MRLQLTSFVLGLLYHSSFALQIPFGSQNIQKADIDISSNNYDRRPLAVNDLPYRPLNWKQLNILHTTDVHGWLSGGLTSSQTSINNTANSKKVDWGDVASFIHHMRNLADEKGVDLLVVDTGDLHDGTGLSNGNPDSTSVPGHESDEIFSMIDYDLLAIGNHELYSYNVAQDVLQNFVPKWQGKFLATNVNITLPNQPSQSIGSRVRRFRTKNNNYKLTAFGILHDFKFPDTNITVTQTSDLMKEDWFQAEIRQDTDAFIILGHMAMFDKNWDLIVSEIRKYHEDKPVLLFAGHEHIRDCRKPDNLSVGMASGQYMETLGFMSVDIENIDSKLPLNYERRYLDTSRQALEYHIPSQNRGQSFNTDLGLKIKKAIVQLRREFDVDKVFGVAPQDFYLSRVPIGHPNSIHSLLLDSILPALVIDDTVLLPVKYLLNTGALRYNIDKGNFTKDNRFMVSPFPNKFFYLVISYEEAERVTQAINKFTALTNVRNLDGRLSSNELTLGHVTHDTCMGKGDDVMHIKTPSYTHPEFISSVTPDESKVALVFISFVASMLLKALNQTYTMDDVRSFSNTTLSQIFEDYAVKYWN